MKRYIFFLGSFAGIIAALFLGVSFLANAQTATSTTGATVSGTTGLGGITFPIPELGNCGSKDECRAYCNDPVNVDACITFGESHGLMSHAEASSSQKFAQALQNGGGPGGCTTPGACRAYCDEVSHIDVCLVFAKQLGVKNDEVSQAKKISAYVKSGGTTPGGCTSKESCQTYCSDFSHAEECYNFAKQAGITHDYGQEKGIHGGIPSGQFQKFLELVKNGETPGGCISKDTCESYCKDQSHFAECLAFAKNAGFVSSSTAESLGVSGGKGPGGCDSRSACAAYCNDPAHQEECYSFAETNGLIPKDRLDDTKEGYSQLLVGLSQMPPEVAACVTSTLGDQLDQIQSGAVVPGPEIGTEIKNCFEKFGKKENPGAALAHVPPQILSCLKEKLGDGFVVPTSTVEISPDIAQAFRMCAESMNMQHDMNMQHGENTLSAPNGNSQFDLGRFLNSAPPGVAVCVKDKLGGQIAAVSSTGTIPPEIYAIVKSCMQGFRPQNGSGIPPLFPDGAEGHSTLLPPSGNASSGIFTTAHMPEQVAQCIQGSLTESEITELKSGVKPNSTLAAKIRACYGQSPSDNDFLTHPPFSSGTVPMPPPSAFHPLLPSPSSTSEGEDMPPVNPPTLSTCPFGESWDKALSLCVDPAAKCAEYGGTWTGSTCKNPPAPTSLLDGSSVFGAILKVFAPLLGM